MSMRRAVGLLLVWLAGQTALSAAEPEKPAGPPGWIVADDTGAISLRSDSASPPFVMGATTLCGPGVRLGTAEGFVHPTLGAGERVHLANASGRSLSLARHRQIPFTVLEARLENFESDPATLAAVDVATLPLELNLPVGQVRVLGTGGLAEASAAPGSYMWIALADPQTRRGVVIGWLACRRGSGVLLPRVVDGRLEVVARIEYGRLRLSPGQVEEVEPLVVGHFDDIRQGLEAYADAVARLNEIHLRPAPCGYCTWYHAGASTAKRISSLARFAARELSPFGLSFVQIDDGWQAGESKNGPHKNFTTHRSQGPYPAGMAATATEIAGLSLTPGLWFMPFAGTWDDPFFRDRQDWFARREDGTPFDTNWGGTCLDLTRPVVQSYLRENVERIVHQWGYRYLKMDGLWTGSATQIEYVNDAYKDDHLGNSILANPEVTHLQALTEGLKLIRQAAGPEVFLLGCCAPQNMRSFGGAFGRVDAMRIGPDNGANVESLAIGPRYGSRNYFLNGRVWWNDPDPVYIRPTLSQGQAELSCGWAAVAGQLTVASDELERMPPERLNLLKRIMPMHTGRARPVDLLEHDPPRVWTVAPAADPDRPSLVGLFNFDAQAVSIDEPLERLGLDPAAEYLAYEFWTGKFLPAIRGRLQWELAPLGNRESAAAERAGQSIARPSAVLAVRPAREHPQLLSTSRHVTQGLVDVTAEQWDSANNSLSGTSRIVGGDPYELRIALPAAAGWKLLSVSAASVTGENPLAGIKVTAGPHEDRLVRVTIQSASSGQVSWIVGFEPSGP